MVLGRARKGKGIKGTGHGRRGLKAASKAAQDAPRPDSDIIFKIRQHLRKAHRIPASRIKTEHAIGIPRGGRAVLLGPARRRKTTLSWGAVRTPDIVVMDEEDGIWFVIEQDGRIHESEKAARRDEARNRHYAAAGIPCIVLSTRAIRSEGVSAAEYLDREIERVLAGSGPGRSRAETPAADGGAAADDTPGWRG